MTRPSILASRQRLPCSSLIVCGLNAASSSGAASSDRLWSRSSVPSAFPLQRLLQPWRLPLLGPASLLPLVFLLFILHSAPRTAACPRRLLAEPIPPVSSLVKDDIVALIAELQEIDKHYSIITQYMQQLVAVPNADFSWGANTTWLLPTDKAITMARKKDKSFLGTITPCHFLQIKRAYSRQQCGEFTPLVFLNGNWTAGSAGGAGADSGGVSCTVKRFLPPPGRVVIGSLDDKKTRGMIVHPSLFEGAYFSAQGVDSIIMP